MKKKKDITLTSLFKKQCFSFQKNANLAKKLGVKNIHNLRVEIKHLKALFRLAKLFPGNKVLTENILEQLRPVFKSAGKIRTASVNLSLIQNISGLSLYVKHLHKTEKNGGEKLKTTLITFDIDLFKHNCVGLAKKMSGFSGKRVTEEANKYVEKTRNKLKKAYKTNISEKQLHEIRKELKIIKTTLQVLYTLTQKKLFKKQTKTLTALEEAIGSWHDKAVLYRDLLSFNKLFSPSSSTATFVSALRIESKTLKRNVTGLLKNYLH